MKIRPLVLSALVFGCITSASYAATQGYPDLTSFDNALTAAGLSGSPFHWANNFRSRTSPLPKCRSRTIMPCCLWVWELRVFLDAVA